MKFKYILLIGLILFLCTIFFGWLIISVTPQLYNLHPFVIEQSKLANESFELSKKLPTDSFSIQGDSIICQIEVVEPYLPNKEQKPTMGDLGTFGDSAGFWNAIFSALAMIFVVVTLMYQFRKDTKEDERARIAQFQEQCLTMLSLLSEIVSQLRISQNSISKFPIESSYGFSDAWIPSTPNQGINAAQQRITSSSLNSDVTGRACFKYIYDERAEGNILDYIVKNFSGPSYNPTEDLYRSLKKVTETHFDHYFRTVYRILKFIKETDLGDIEKKKQDDIRDLCADLVRAQLSTYELAILYYNGLYPKYRNTSKEIYEHFCLFDNLDPQFLILSAEKEYYQQVQKCHKNMDNYNETIHYNCTAFTKVEKHDSNKRINQKWFKLPAFSLCKRHSDYNMVLSAKFDLESEELAVYNTLKARSGQVVTIKELVNLSRVNEKALKKILAKFDGKIVRTESTPNGKRYTIIDNK